MCRLGSRPETAREVPRDVGVQNERGSFGYRCALWLSECLRVAKAGAPICVFTDWRQLPTTTDVLQAGGFVWRGLVVWDKTEACRPAMGRFAAQWTGLGRPLPRMRHGRSLLSSHD